MMLSPGWHEVVGLPGAGKTLLAILLSQQYERVLWVMTPQEDVGDLWTRLDYRPTWFCEVSTVSEAFSSMQTIDVQFIVLDSLTGLLPNHPQAKTIAHDIRQAFFEPSIPILVTSQIRYPASSGGSYWKSLVTHHRLELFRQSPALYSQLLPEDEWLVWWDDVGPVLRGLEKTDLNWLPERVREEHGWRPSV